MTLRDIRPVDEVGAVEQVIANMPETEPVIVSGPWTTFCGTGGGSRSRYRRTRSASRESGRDSPWCRT